jgi:hypothetical protein
MHDDLPGALADAEQVLKFITEESHQALALANAYDCGDWIRVPGPRGWGDKR